MSSDFRSRLIPVETSAEDLEEPSFKSRLIPTETLEPEDDRSFLEKTKEGFGEALKMQMQSGGFVGAPSLTPEQAKHVASDVGTIALLESIFGPLTALAGRSSVLPGTLQAILRTTEAASTGVALDTVHSLLEKGEVPSKEELVKAGVSTAIIDGLFRGTLSTTQALRQMKRAEAKLPSGLTKIKAVEAKKPELGTLSKERRAEVIQKLDKEAADLSKKAIEKHVPISKQIEEGVDFKNKFAKDFKKVDDLAAKANPDITIEPISKLMVEQRKKYAGIPELHSDAKKIMIEAQKFSRRPPEDLHTALKIFRSNNQKKESIYEKARLLGSRREYVKFLDDYNRAIRDSFKETLPANSAWLKMFEESNREYASYQKAIKTMNQLKGVFSEHPSLAQVEKLARDVKAQKKLALTMGEKGAQEITQIAKDLKTTTQALKKMPRSELSKFDRYFPLYFLIPWIGKYLGAYKGLKAARYMYGWFLSTPAKRKAMSEALKAIEKDDLSAYRKAAAVLSQEEID